VTKDVPDATLLNASNAIPAFSYQMGNAKLSAVEEPSQMTIRNALTAGKTVSCAIMTETAEFARKDSSLRVAAASPNVGPGSP